MSEIVSFAVSSPRDWQSLCSLGTSLVGPLQHQSRTLWRGLFAERWPAFEECLTYREEHSGRQDWRLLYKEMLEGRLACTLEVFDREKKKGFAMSALPARVHYEAKQNAYIAKYLSVSEVFPEVIPCSEEHRLRFCPVSVREQLRPTLSQVAESTADAYPYRALEGTEGLHVGMGVEMQWKMQAGSPFGWWYGVLEELHPVPDTDLFAATIDFRHFPTSSRWHRLSIHFGTAEIQYCSIGGFNGGIRPASEAEKHRWMQFFPKELVTFW